MAADFLTSAWDQNCGLYVGSPALGVVEETVARWVLDLAGLPATASVGFVTGCQMANFTALAAARHAVLAKLGWDVEEDGLQGAPKITVVVGVEAHVTIFRALRFLGLGPRHAVRVAVDSQGRMRAESLRLALARIDGPAIVCAQAGNVNSGAFDPLEEIAAACRARGAFLHVDAAFGLWAAASPALRDQLRGCDQADSWASDAHKWLNVPYDSGLVMVRDPAAHRAAMTATAAYLESAAPGAARDGVDWVPEFSRRGRGFALYAQLRALGREGVRALVERSCALAKRAAAGLSAAGARVLNEVTLNQVLARFEPPGRTPAEADALTRAVVARVQREGACWLSGSTWQGQGVLRFSISGEATREADLDRSVAAIVAAARAEGALPT